MMAFAALKLIEICVIEVCVLVVMRLIALHTPNVLRIQIQILHFSTTASPSLPIGSKLELCVNILRASDIH